MGLLRNFLKPLSDGNKIHPSDILGGIAAMVPGRMFWVAPATMTNYDQFFAEHNVVDFSNTNSVYNTEDAAISACVAGRGDVIFVMPGYSATVTSTSIALDVAGVTVICLGTGLARPTWTYSTATATINVSAANCSWVGGYHIANFADVAAAFTLTTAKDFALTGNTFAEAGTDLNWFNIVVTSTTDNAADGLNCLSNKVYMNDAAGKAFISILGNCARLVANYNVVITASTADAAQFITLAAKAITFAEIKWNNLVFTGDNNASTVGLFLTGSSTACSGIVAFNTVNSLDTTTALFATAGTKLSYQENYVSGAADKQGTLYPAADNPA